MTRPRPVVDPVLAREALWWQHMRLLEHKERAICRARERRRREWVRLDRQIYTCRRCLRPRLPEGIGRHRCKVALPLHAEMRISTLLPTRRPKKGTTMATQTAEPIHTDSSPLAGETVVIRPKGQGAAFEFIVEDYWDRIAPESWMFSDGNPACITYALRAGAAALPIDDEVLYGKVGGYGMLAHVSEVVQ